MNFDKSMYSVLNQSVRLSLAMAAAWCLLAVPAYLVGAWEAVAGLTGAVLVCLLPGIVVLSLQSGRWMGREPMTVALVGMGVRLVCVLGAAVLVRQAWPDLAFSRFLVWLVPSYLVALLVETRMVMPPRAGRVEPATEKSPGNSRHFRAAGSS